jgi:hypothetical protein
VLHVSGLACGIETFRLAVKFPTRVKAAGTQQDSLRKTRASDGLVDSATDVELDPTLLVKGVTATGSRDDASFAKRR